MVSEKAYYKLMKVVHIVAPVVVFILAIECSIVFFINAINNTFASTVEMLSLNALTIVLLIASLYILEQAQSKLKEYQAKRKAI